MATLVASTLVATGGSTVGTTAGTDVTANQATPTAGTGDLVPINTGRGTLIIWTTAGTGATVVVDTIVPSNYGIDQDLTVTLPATGIVCLFIANDGIRRFDQGGGSAGLAKITPSVNTTQKVVAVIIP